MAVTRRASRRKQFNDLLERSGWTHDQCAKHLRVHRVTVSRWACGQEQITESRLVAMANAVDIHLATADLLEVM